MRYSKITYHLYLFAILCMTFTSCAGDAFLEDEPYNGSQQPDTKLVFSLNMPEGAGNSTTDGKAYEQYINDMYVYAFDKKDGSFIEKVDNLNISGNDGDKTRFIIGILKNDYTTFSSGIEFVLLTNLEEKGVVAPDLTTADHKEDLYKKLNYVFSSEDNFWIFKNETHYIPMWGICSFSEIRQGVNQTNISLYRAIAKINVTLNKGNGFDHFKLDAIQLYNVNTQGYCAPIDEDLSTPSIPTTTQQVSTSYTCSNDNERKGGLQERIYIPEYKNIGTAVEKQSYLKITGELSTTTGETVNKTYEIRFKKNGTGTDFDVLRNNLYIFNITSISNEIAVESQLSYTVEKWEQIEIDIPSFN